MISFIYLSCCLPKSIGKLRQLRYLDLAKNRIESLDADISGCESVEDLLLSSNMLQQLPDSIGKVPLLALLEIFGVLGVIQYIRLLVHDVSIMLQES